MPSKFEVSRVMTDTIAKMIWIYSNLLEQE